MHAFVLLVLRCFVVSLGQPLGAAAADPPAIFPVVDAGGGNFDVVVIEGDDGEYYLVGLGSGHPGASQPIPAGTYMHYECDTVLRPCPPGYLREPDGKYNGCVPGQGGGCSGFCHWCLGSSYNGRWCRPKADATRFIPSPGPVVGCGQLFHVPCTTTVPASPPSIPLPPNGCYCDGTQPRVLVSGEVCLVRECQ